MSRQYLLSEPLPMNKRIAFVTSPRLGDSLIAMITAYNFRRAGYDITVFSRYLNELKNWFPHDKIIPVPDLQEGKEILSAFDVVLYSYRHDIFGKVEWHPQLIVLADSPLYARPISMVDIQAAVCCEDLHLRDAVRNNDLVPPPELKNKKFPKRVVMHPTSHQTFRSWLPKRFIQFAKLLQQGGYEPAMIVAPHEHRDWLWVKEVGIQLPAFNNLDETARYIYESAFFVGNDSGIGHLASNLNIPTLTLGVRPSLLRQWRPSWAPSAVVLPPIWLIMRPVKEKLWKYFISSQKVWRTFEALVVKVDH